MTPNFPPQFRNGNGIPPQMNSGGFPQFGAGGGPPMRQQGGGGLLSKLLGKGNQARGAAAGGNVLGASRAATAATGATGATGEAGGGILKALSNPTAINGFLTNTQKMLNSASQLGPMVQQYGPLVKNIPSVWKLYKGMTGSKDEAKNNEKKSTTEKKSKKKNATVKVKDNEKISENSPPPKAKEIKIRMSKPKLYV
ncbi:hypothetical protein KDN24_09500 [Bacillus sp. Bva_UNVM-123]